MFLKGKMRKSGGTNVPPLLLVEYNTLRAALVKGRRRSVSSKVELKSVCFFSLPKRDFTKEQRRKETESAETEVVTKRID